MKPMISLCLLTLAGTLIAQDPQPPLLDASYYPLAVGMAWEYKTGPIRGVTSRSTHHVRKYNNSDKSYVIESTAYTTYNGQTMDFPTGKRIRVNAQGVFCVSSWSWLKQDKAKEKMTCELKFPIRIGSTWTKKEGDANGHLTTVSTIIRRTDVTIGLGTYRDVIVVQTKQHGVIDGKAYNSETYSYFAPSVGLIKTDYLDEQTGQISVLSELVRFIPDSRELDRELGRNRVRRNP